MARMPRLAVAGQPHLVIQRSNGAVFNDDADRAQYLTALSESLANQEVALHAYSLIDDAVLLLASPDEASGLGHFMQRVNRRFVASHHRRHGSSGPLWAGRFQATVVEAEAYLLCCMRWIEQAPVRTGAVSLAEEWPWSSAAHHVGNAASSMLTPHSTWWRLGNTPFEREASHRAALHLMVSQERGDAMIAAARRGSPLGSPAFVAAAIQGTSRPVLPRPRGRPARTKL